MACYREIGMWEIHEVLRRVARGEPQRAIQRATGHSRHDPALAPVVVSTLVCEIAGEGLEFSEA